MQAETKSISKRKRSIKKKFLPFSIGVFTLSLLSVFGVSFYVGWSLTHPEKIPITDEPSNYGLQYKDISFESEDGKTKLEGWVIEPTTKAKMSIVFSHGYKMNRYHHLGNFLPLSKELAQAGYRVIMFDYRNSGNSEGDFTTVGVYEKYDLLGAIHWTKTQYKEPVALYGASMGASTALVAAGEDKDVIGVVADSPFSDLESYLEENLSVWSELPKIPFTPAILFLLPTVLDVDLSQTSPIRSLELISPRPILFIHGESDGKIPFSESVKMASTNQESFELWTPKGVDHVGGFVSNPKEYAKRVISFYEHTLHNETKGM